MLSFVGDISKGNIYCMSVYSCICNCVCLYACVSTMNEGDDVVFISISLAIHSFLFSVR